MTLAPFLAIFLGYPSFAQQDLAEAQFAQGVRYTQNGEHGKAHVSFLNALKLRPNSIPVLNNLGVNALHRGDEPAAERYFRRTLVLAPNDVNALFNLGLIELKHKKFPAAALHLGKSRRQSQGPFLRGCGARNPFATGTFPGACQKLLV